MIVTSIKVSLHFSQSRSLKEKRRLLKSIVEKVRQRFNVSIAEVADQNLWQKATIGISFISLSPFQAKKQAHDIRTFIEVLDKGAMSQYDYETIKTLEI